MKKNKTQEIANITKGINVSREEKLENVGNVRSNNLLEIGGLEKGSDEGQHIVFELI